MKNEVAESAYMLIMPRSVKQTKASITLEWKKVPGAKRYVIYGTRCGKTTKFRKLKTVKGNDTTTIRVIAGKKLKKGTYYKFNVVVLDSRNKIITTSKTIHVATKGGKFGNVGKITTEAKTNKVIIRKGKTFKLCAKQVVANKKLKVKTHRKLKYESSKKEVATVTSKGVITGKKKGSCYIYAYAQNGAYKRIKVTVK